MGDKGLSVSPEDRLRISLYRIDGNLGVDEFSIILKLLDDGISSEQLAIQLMVFDLRVDGSWGAVIEKWDLMSPGFRRGYRIRSSAIMNIYRGDCKPGGVSNDSNGLTTEKMIVSEKSMVHNTHHLTIADKFDPLPLQQPPVSSTSQISNKISVAAADAVGITSPSLLKDKYKSIFQRMDAGTEKYELAYQLMCADLEHALGWEETAYETSKKEKELFYRREWASLSDRRRNFYLDKVKELLLLQQQACEQLKSSTVKENEVSRNAVVRRRRSSTSMRSSSSSSSSSSAVESSHREVIAKPVIVLTEKRKYERKQPLKKQLPLVVYSSTDSESEYTTAIAGTTGLAGIRKPRVSTGGMIDQKRRMGSDQKKRRATESEDDLQLKKKKMRRTNNIEAVESDNDDDDEEQSDDDIQSIDDDPTDEDNLYDAVLVQGRDDGDDGGEQNEGSKLSDDLRLSAANKKQEEEEEDSNDEAAVDDVDIVEAIQNGIDELTIALRLMRKDAPTVETKTRKISRNNEKNEHLREVEETNRLWRLLTLVKQRYYRNKARELIEKYTTPAVPVGSTSQRRDVSVDKQVTGRKQVVEAAGKKVKWVDDPAVPPPPQSSRAAPPSSSTGSSSSSSRRRGKERARSTNSDRTSRKSSHGTAPASGLHIGDHRLLQMAYHDILPQPADTNDKENAEEIRSKRSRSSNNNNNKAGAAAIAVEAAQHKTLSILKPMPSGSTRQLRRDRLHGPVVDASPAVSQYYIRVGDNYQAVVEEWDEQAVQLQQQRQHEHKGSTLLSSDDAAYKPLYDEDSIELYLQKALSIASSLREDLQREEASKSVKNRAVLCILANNAEDVCLEFLHKNGGDVEHCLSEVSTQLQALISVWSTDEQNAIGEAFMKGGQHRKRMHSCVPGKSMQEVAEYVSRFLELSLDLEMRVENEFYDRLEALPNGPKIIHDHRSTTDDELQKQAVELVSRISKSIDKESFNSFMNLLAALYNFVEPSVSALIIKVHYIINNASLTVIADEALSDVQPFRSKGDIVRAFDSFLPSLVAQHLR